MSIGERLAEERNRIGMSQPDFAALGGRTKKTQIEWEKGEAYPNAAYLAAIAVAGADIQYIVTGIRSANALNADEQELVGYWRAANLAGRAAAVAALTAVAAPTGRIKQKVSGNANQVVGVNTGEVHGTDQAGGRRKR